MLFSDKVKTGEITEWISIKYGPSRDSNKSSVNLILVHISLKQPILYTSSNQSDFFSQIQIVYEQTANHMK
jgi:hypothetical protein